MLKTRVRASLERPGPHRGELHECSTPTECRMHMGHAGHTQPNQAQKSNPPRNPQQEPRKGGRPTRWGIPRKPPGDLREPRFGRHFLQTVADTARPWGSQIVQPPVRGNRQSWRVETGGRPKRTKNLKKGNTPTPPPTQDGARGTQVPVGSEYTTPPPKG